MAYFPTSPLDGASVTVNGILYTYNAANGAWKRSPTTIGNLTVTGNITAANITLTSNAAANKFYVTEGVFWAGNGVAFASSTYSNANVASYLLTGAVIGAGSSNVIIGATTQSDSTSTGALVVQGGAGIAGNLYVGGNLIVSNVSYEYREIVTTTETVQGNIVAASSQASTSTTTGALVVVGGAGIGGALFITNTGDVSANIGSLIANAATQQTQINNIITNANANVAAYLPTYTGNIGAGNIVTTGISGNISGVNYILASNYVYPNGVSILTGIGGTYSNTNVEAYFGANIGSLLVNAATQATSINTINANLGAYQIYANANIGSLLVNAATQATSINDINANLGAYQIYANANIGTLFLGNLTTQANLGAFQTYANTTFTSYSNTNAAAYLTLGATIGSGSTTANLVAAATTTSTSTTTGALVVLGGAGVAGNVYADKFYTANGIFWSGNGAAYAAGGGGGGSSFTYTASATAPGSPVVGDQWFDTTDGTLYEYIDDGDSDQWVDIQSPTLASDSNITSISGNIIVSGNISASSIIITSGIFWSNGVSTLGSSIYGNTEVAQYLPTFTGALTPSLITNSGNLTVAGNIVQQQAYYETFGNLTNVGGNLTCNFNNGTIFNVTSITANVTANFTNVNAISNGATGAVVLLTQGATAYKIANVQINGVNTYVRWVNGNSSGISPMGLASNTDIVSFSIMHLGSDSWMVFGQLSSFA